MKRSIRWTLLGWYALILTSVIGALGGVLIVQQRDAALHAIDAQLDALAASVATAVEWEEEDWYEFEPRETFAAEIAGVAAVAGEAPYYAVWDGEGEVLGLYGTLPDSWFTHRDTDGDDTQEIAWEPDHWDEEQREHEFHDWVEDYIEEYEEDRRERRREDEDEDDDEDEGEDWEEHENDADREADDEDGNGDGDRDDPWGDWPDEWPDETWDEADVAEWLSELRALWEEELEVDRRDHEEWLEHLARLRERAADGEDLNEEELRDLLINRRPRRLGSRSSSGADGEWREVVVAGPRGARVLVGVDTSRVRSSSDAASMATVGACLLALMTALVGGWFLVSRVLRPIDRITQTAAGIRAHSLSERIDVAHTESELGRLAATLNDTFAELEQAFARQVRFTSDASHELRTPLSVLIAHGELALRKERKPDEYRDALNVMLRSARRMNDLVERLLQLSRGDADSDIAREPVGLDRLLADIGRDLGPIAAERGIKLATNLQSATVLGESGLLTAAFTNIVSNAVRYNRDGGRVDVLLSRRNGRAVVTVTDTGVGIPTDALAAVFERFYRVDTARSRAAGGSGLGLAIAKQVIDAHDGTIAIQSAVGSGTTVTIELPCEA